MAQQPQELEVGAGLFVMILPIIDLKERDVNAQVVQPRHMDRLTSNIRDRGQVESLPYVHWPNRKGPKVIISGHHRSRAARKAGLTEIPCLVDVLPMSESKIISKQIAHNEIHGSPDEQILAEMIAAIDNVDDLLATGLPEDKLPHPDKDGVNLGIPSAQFDWRLLTFLFLPHQLEQLEAVLDNLDKHSAIIGVAPREDFEEFSRKVIDYGRALNIRSAGAAVAALITIAAREIELAATDGVKPDGTWTRVAEMTGPAMPPDAAKVVRQAIGKVIADGDAPAEQPWIALERICADFLAGA